MKIPRQLVEYAARHTVDSGDTDIFPFPVEIHFYRDQFEKVVDRLAETDIESFSPMSLVESLVPKTKFGFRVGHQPYLSDTILFTALVCSLADAVEEGRSDTYDGIAFSYRKSKGMSFPFFVEGRSFKDWVESMWRYSFSSDYSHVIRTDISDFYMRIYRHRLENILDSLSGETIYVKKIERILHVWRGGQSFGIPVGTDAARLLAEATLHDTDMALLSEGYQHTRYMDDFTIFIRKGQDPYAALSFLARHLFENEGRSLNNQKTTIFSWEEFLSANPGPNAEDAETRENWATERLFWAAYAKDEVDPDALATLMTKDLVAELEARLDEPFWDMGAIRIVLHAMKLVGAEDVAKYVRQNLGKLVPFARDIFFLVEHLVGKGSTAFDDVSDELTELIVSDRVKSLDGVRAWFLELGVRGIVRFSPANIRRLDSLSGTLDIRQLHLLRWRSRDVNYFRSRKARLSEIQLWAQPTFVFGASCLPKDEYSHWIRGIKSRLNFPLAREFCDWCLASAESDPFKLKKAP